MRKVNLLPAWYLKERYERRMLRTRVLLIICLASAMLAWWLGSNVQTRKLETLAGELREQREIVRNLAQDVRVSEKHNKVLEQRAASYRELGQPAPIYELLQQLHNELTAGMALSGVTMDVRQEPLPGSGNVGDANNPPRYRHTAVFRVDGIAPSDQQVAQLVDHLAHNPLFADISMNFTRPDTVRGMAVRRFQIRLSVDLERIPAGDPAATLQALTEHEDHAS